MSVHILVPDNRLDQFVSVLSSRLILCVPGASRDFMDFATPQLLRAGYAYVYAEDPPGGVCVAWHASKFEATACRTVPLRHSSAVSPTLLARLLPFLAHRPADVSHRVVWVRLRQVATSRDVDIVACNVPCTTDVGVAADLSRRLAELGTDGQGLIVAGNWGSSTTRDQLVRAGWKDACPSTPGTVSVLSQGGLIQFRGTPGGDGVCAQFY